uniref:Cytosolic endo-beta-N-acetylglucosaminidase n=1 Tax=Myripristis murdjan TaxID=586833 RepID=A0A667YW64_9TELE
MLLHIVLFIRLESCLDPSVDSSSVHEVINYTPSSLPVKHYDTDTTEPVICGLQTLEELLSWQRSEANPFNVAAVPLAAREPPLSSSSRRTLVSHDMMGGYLDDRFAQGTDSESPYAFYHWQYIDIFNYFTHNLVTIPPAVWTNAAHKHGVVMLGTFITEWTDGAKVCETFLKGEESYRAVADRLVQISHYYGFDGWLVNIENTLSEAAVKNTPLFLRYLTDQMHERVPGSQVLWYDSVLETGQLKWQNELNQSNRVFFDACDGFFTNYNWTEQSLEWMKTYSGAQGRQADIYVGVDVFARGEVVGGMFDTNKALEIIRKHDFSTAIFAPGWVYETHNDKTEFRKNQDKFWALLSEFLYIHRPTSPLPFISSFCQGFGKSLYWRGQRETKKNWFNLSAQELQPLYYSEQFGANGWLTSRGCPEDAWNGGCSLLLEGLIPASLNKVCARIFSLHVPLASNTLVSFIYKPSAGITVSLELKTTDASLCTHQGIRDINCKFQSISDTQGLSPERNDLCNISILKLHLAIFCPLEGVEGTNSLLLETKVKKCWVFYGNQGHILLCSQSDISFPCHYFHSPPPLHKVLDTTSLLVPPESIQRLCIYDVVWLRGTCVSPESNLPCLYLNATLRWSYPSELVRHFRVYWRRLRGPDPRIPPGQMVLVGRAYSTLFRLTELVVPEPPGLMELVVEPVIREGFLVPESHWGRQSLSYSESQVTAT